MRFIIAALALMAMFSTASGSTGTSGTSTSTSTGGTSTGSTSTSTGGTSTGGTSTSTGGTSTGGTTTVITSTSTGGGTGTSTSTSSTSTGGGVTSSENAVSSTSGTSTGPVLSAQVGVGEESITGFVWTHKIQNPDLDGDVGCIYYAVTEKTETLSVAEMQDPLASGKVLNNHPQCSGKLLQHLDIQETRQDCPLEASTEYWFWYGVDYNCDGTDAIINSPVVLKVPEAKDCVGHWEPCDSTCTSLYFLDNPQSGGGTPCPFQDLDSKTCTPGTDACPPEVQSTTPPTKPTSPASTPRPPCFLPMEDTEEGSALLIYQRTGCWPVESQEYDNDLMFGVRPGTIFPGTMPGMNIAQPAIGSMINPFPYFNTDGDESPYNNMIVRGLPGSVGGMGGMMPGMGMMGGMGGYYFGEGSRLEKPRPAAHKLLRSPHAGRPTRPISRNPQARAILENKKQNIKYYPIYRKINPSQNIYKKRLSAIHRLRRNPSHDWHEMDFVDLYG